MAKIPTVKFVLQKKYASDEEGYVKIRVWVNRSKFLVKSLRHKIPATSWDAENEIVRKGLKHFDVINREIHTERARIESALWERLRQHGTFTQEFIESVLDPREGPGGFLQFFKDHVEHIQSRHSKQYHLHWEVEYNQLKKHSKGDVPFHAVTTEWLEKYERSLTCAATTKNTKFKRLKEVVLKAVDRGMIEPKQIAGYKWPAYKAPERPYLTLAQTKKLADKIYKGEYDADPETKKVACYFLIECYSGIRFSDWPRFTVETLIKDRNLKVRAKKNQEPVYLPLGTFKSLGRVVDYVLKNKIEFDLTEASTNRILKTIGREIGMQGLTTHIGRHTCATLLAELGYSTRAIAEVLGISEQTAQVYVKATKQALNNEFEKYGGI